MYIHACPHLIKCFITVIAPWLCCSCWVLSARLNLQPCSIYFLSTLPEFFSSFYTCVPVLWSLSVCIYKILTKFLTSTSFEWFPVSSLKLSITSKPTVWSNPTLRPYMTKSNLPAVLVASWTMPFTSEFAHSTISQPVTLCFCFLFFLFLHHTCAFKMLIHSAHPKYVYPSSNFIQSFTESTLSPLNTLSF